MPNRGLLLTVLLFSAALRASAQPHFDFLNPFEPPRAVQIIAHRGMHVVAPENTVDVLAAGGDDFIEWCEADVRRTVESHRKALRNGIDVIQTDHPLRAWRAVELESAAPSP